MADVSTQQNFTDFVTYDCWHSSCPTAPLIEKCYSEKSGVVFVLHAAVTVAVAEVRTGLS